MAKFLDKLIYWENGAFRYDWDAIAKVPEFAVLKNCKQSDKWHSEGTAWQHTKNVCKVMVDEVIGRNKFYCMSRWMELYSYNSDMRADAEKYFTRILMTVALFHDIGKGTTTFEKNGVWHSYNHEFEGERIARYLLWDEDIYFREEVCALIRYHMDVLRLFDKKDVYTGILELATKVRMEPLICLKYADCMGSKPTVEHSHEIDNEKLEELYSICFRFKCLWSVNDMTMNGKFSWKRFEKEQKSKVNLCVLIGLPGAGKDTFIEKTIFSGKDTVRFDGWDKDNTVVVCRDTIREDMHIAMPGEKMMGTPEEETKVTEQFNQSLLQAAADGKNIIINNMNIRRKYRDDYKKLLHKYDLHILYVYVQNCPLADVIKRRSDWIPAAQYRGMIEKIDWPMPDEYDSIWIETKLN